MIYKDKPLTEKRKQKLRGKDIVLIPQSVGFLNPLKTAGAQVIRSAYLACADAGKAAELRDVAFNNYSLSSETKNLYPHEISGGMARRVLTAMATVSGASLIIADEPTTGLDSITRDESLSILRALADEGKGVILITHDLNAAVRYADRIAVFYAGTTVESAPAENFRIPAMLNHPYSRALINALPQNNFSFSGISQPESYKKNSDADSV
jgi:peptide/nickel transport system ATP-binding protein